MHDSVSAHPRTFSHRLDAIARFLILAVVFMLPLVTLPSGWLSLATVKMDTLAFGVLGALILWSVARLNEHRVSFPGVRLLWVAPLLVAGYFLAAVLSGNVLHALIGFGFESDTVLAVATFISACAAVALTTRSATHLIRLQKAALASFLLLGIFHILRVTFGADTFFPTLFSANPTATTLGSWNDLAVFAGLALLSILAALAFVPMRTRARGVLYATTVVSLFLLVLVNVSVVWVALVLAASLITLYILSDALYDRESGRFMPHIPWARLLPSLGVLVVSIAFLFAGSAVSTQITQTFDIAFADVRPSWEGTIAVGAEVFKDNILFGVGPNAFQDAWTAYKPATVNETAFWNTDFTMGVGFIPTAFVTGGIVVGLLWLLFLMVFVYLGVRVLVKRIVQPVHLYLIASTYIGATYLWILSIVYVPQTVMLAYTFMLTGAVVAAMCIAGVVRTHSVRAEANYTAGFVLTSSVLVVAIVSFGLLFVHAERAVASVMLSRAIAAANEGDFDTAVYIADRISLFGGDTRSAQLKTTVGLARLAQTLNEETEDREAQRTMLQQEITDTVSAARAVVDADPQNYRSWILLGNVYARLTALNIDGAYDSAVAAFTQAQTLSPNSPLPQINLARLALTQGDLTQAREYIQEALARKSNYTDAYYLLSQIAIREGNVTDAIKSTEAAVLLRPRNPGLLFQLGVLHYSTGAYAQVIPVLERAVTLNPNYANALYFLGLAYDKVGNVQGALAAFERVAALNPDNVEVQRIVTALTEGKSAFDALGDGAPTISGAEQLPISDDR